MDIVDGDIVHAIRCEFSASDFDSADSEAFLVSSPFIPEVSLALVFVYNISSPDTTVDLFIVSHFTDDVIQRHSFPHKQDFYMTIIPSMFEPMYVVLNAYRSVSAATSSLSSVTITMTYMTPHDESKYSSYCDYVVLYTSEIVTLIIALLTSFYFWKVSRKYTRL